MKRNQSISIFLTLLFFITLQLVIIPVKAENISEFKDGILSYQCRQSHSDTIQNWIDGELTENAGVSSEWYIMALSQSGSYDFSAYRQALENYIATHEVYSASTRLKYAMVLASVGGADSPYIAETLSNSIGQQGIMSWIYGLHLLNNGFICEEYPVNDVINTLLSLQLADSGWAVMGTNGDIDVTAMAVQSLAPYYGNIPEVHQAIDNAVNFLAERQKDYGGYASFGTENLESTAQVVTALSSIGIDSFSDGQFIKNNHTLLDGMNRYRLANGSYSHIDNGEMNFLATMQAFYTFVAYERFQQGKSPLYVLDAVQAPLVTTEPLPNELPVENPPPENADNSPLENAPEIVDTPQNPEPIPQNDEPVIIDEDGTISTNPNQTTPSTTAVNPSATSESSSMSITTASDIVTSHTSTMLTMTTSRKLQTTTTVTLSTSVSSFAIASTAPTIMTTAIDSSREIIDNPQKFSVKMMIMLGILGCGMIVCIVLFALKKRNPKNFLFVGIVTALGMSAVYFIRIQSANQYYSDKLDQKTQQGSVTISIRCDTLVGKFQSEYIPENGIILDVTEIPLSEGDTVYTILTETVQANHIQMEHKENGYIAGINYLYELQYGDLSGWMYRVNGEFPSVGCNEYQLHDGDSIEWLYTCNIGNDLN